MANSCTSSGLSQSEVTTVATIVAPAAAVELLLLSGLPPLDPRVGLGYRSQVDRWIRANLASFGVLEVTVDHCLAGGEATRASIFDLVGKIPLTAHGIGLSIGTEA